MRIGSQQGRRRRFDHPHRLPFPLAVAQKKRHTQAMTYTDAIAQQAAHRGVLPASCRPKPNWNRSRSPLGASVMDWGAFSLKLWWTNCERQA